MSSASNESKTYTVSESALILGIPESTLYRQLRDGKAEHLRPIRVGVWRLPRRIIDALANGEEIAA